jgi:hypothetical protein
MSLPDLIGRCALVWLGAGASGRGPKLGCPRDADAYCQAHERERIQAVAPIGKHPSAGARLDASALVGPDQLGLGEYVPLGDRLDLRAAGVGSQQQAWLAQRHQAEMVVVHGNRECRSR